MRISKILISYLETIYISLSNPEKYERPWSRLVLKSQTRYIPGLTRQFSTNRCLLASETINSGNEASDEKNINDKESSGYESSNPEVANPEAPRSVSSDGENTVEERIISKYLLNKDPNGVHRSGGPDTVSDEEYSSDSSTVSDWKDRWKYISQETELEAHASAKRQRNADDYSTAHYANDRGYQQGKISKDMYETNKELIEVKYAIKKAAVNDRENSTRLFMEDQTAVDSGMDGNRPNVDVAVTSGSESDNYFRDVPNILPPSSRMEYVPRVNTELFQEEAAQGVSVENPPVSSEEKVESNPFDAEIKELDKRKRDDSDENPETESNSKGKKLKTNNEDSDNNGGPSNEGPSGEGSLGMEVESTLAENPEFSKDNDVERQITEINDAYFLGKPFTEISESDNITNIADFLILFSNNLG